MMRGTGNPGGEGHAWCKRRFIDPCGGDGSVIYVDPKTELERRFIPSKVSDNPILMLNDPGYIKRLEALPEMMRRQLLEGDWGAVAGMALSDFNCSVHFVEPFEIPDYWWHFGALDWGFQHPMSWVTRPSRPTGFARS